MAGQDVKSISISWRLASTGPGPSVGGTCVQSKHCEKVLSMTFTMLRSGIARLRSAIKQVDAALETSASRTGLSVSAWNDPTSDLKSPRKANGRDSSSPHMREPLSWFKAFGMVIGIGHLHYLFIYCTPYIQS